ncbi:SPRY domain-containing SOCS box protein 3-like isoform X2 [Pseudomyrmex gracilis]|uniref:SPRY domain-containing SOCS box protein 3-like isoform X2 n=1 Tax=Pseudomyrmex gracilis TaxID=219809 RepID=UPI000995B0D4|nr:SPRY domain-containing SOCS box protein 3-like isoform X2 [Pseudomyrmex gracilis]
MKKSDTSCEKKETTILEKSDSRPHEWTWDESYVKKLHSSIVVSQENTQILFNPTGGLHTYGVLRGDKPLEKGRHHFWGIHITGFQTSIIVGVGTAKAATSSSYSIGQDCESWGFLCSELSLHHDGKKKDLDYNHFDSNYLIRIHLDTWAGTLQFFYNRRPLGDAFRNLNNYTLYPLISYTTYMYTRELSTKVILTYSMSIPASLQSACVKVLTRSQKQILRKKFPGLRHLCYFADMLRKQNDFCFLPDVNLVLIFV